jgi:hypothetical protein
MDRDCTLRRLFLEAAAVLKDRAWDSWFEEFCDSLSVNENEQRALLKFRHADATDRCCKMSGAKAARDMDCEYAPYNDVCYCYDCMPDESEEASGKGVGYLFVYPSYSYEPLMRDNPLQQAIKKTVHGYLAQLRKVPRPLPHMFDDHVKMFKPKCGTMMSCTGYCDSQRIRDFVKHNAPSYEVLFIMFCGHGASKGAFIASDGSPVRQDAIAGWLKQANFAGTVVCVFNCCHAEDDIRDDAPAESWEKSSPFNWIHVYSSGSYETQKPKHASHVATTVAAVVNDPPSYANLQDEIKRVFKATRARLTNVAEWRACPVVSCGGHYAGRFMQPARR